LRRSIVIESLTAYVRVLMRFPFLGRPGP
jgi:hypothetical protein